MAPAVVLTKNYWGRKDKAKEAKTEKNVTGRDRREVTRRENQPAPRETRHDLALHYFARARDEYRGAIRRSDNDPCSRN